MLIPREALTPLANDPIMSGTSIQLFRRLEHQRLSSNGSDIFLVSVLDTRETVVPLANDPIIWRRSLQLLRHLEHQNTSSNG